MIKYVIALILIVPLAVCQAAGNSIALDQVHVNINNIVSIKRGAKFYAKNCMVCHSMRYFTHNKIADQAGIALAKMPLKNRQWWLGVVPPDLSLIARQKSPAWLYTYMHSFYKDEKQPTGYNNLLVDRSVMMNIFAPMQGIQVLAKPHKDAYKILHAQQHYYELLQLVRQGSMTPAEFDQTTQDLVNFLVYAADPHAAYRMRLGVWVLLFLAVLFVLAYFLKKEYWKDVK